MRLHRSKRGSDGRRRGTGRGSGGNLIIEGSNLRIVIINSVKFASDVKNIQRQVQTALDQQTAAMERKLEHFLSRAGKAPGFR